MTTYELIQGVRKQAKAVIVALEKSGEVSAAIQMMGVLDCCGKAGRVLVLPDAEVLIESGKVEVETV